MEAGIVGLPNIGKTMLFKALTGQDADTSNFPFTTTAPQTAVAQVPEPRLATINQYIQTQKLIPATLEVVDMPALVRGASEGEGMGNQFLAQIRNVDALIHVVRCFEDDDVPHVDDSINPIRDIETVELELIAADAAVVSGSMDKAKKLARLGDKDAENRLSGLEKCDAALGDLTPVRAVDLTDAQVKALRSYALLTAKPVLYIANVAEDQMAEGNQMARRVADHAAEQGGQSVTVCAKIEAELAELDPADQQEMLESLGMSEPALATVARAAFKLLGLHSFFTAGPKEIRAWPVRIGAPAPEAAGVIHSDLQRGFIRAEVYSVDDLIEHQSEAAIKAAGKMRKEGKNYIIRDSDVCHFLFNA
jgi:hypothetical protein